MDQNFSSTKLPTSASQSPSDDGAAWVNPSNITADDGSSSSVSYFNGGDHGATITGTDFDFQQLPDSAVIDGIEVFIDGTNVGCYGSVSISLQALGGSKDMGTLSGNYGGPNDLWGQTSIDPADISSISVSVDTGDVSGGDGFASIDYLSVTVYWHIEVANAETDVPTRFAYKVYSRDGNYLGELPNVTSKFGFTQDKNSAGSSIVIQCGKFVNNEVAVEALLDDDSNIITTDDDEPILTSEIDIVVATGDSPNEAIFKNSNRIQVWVYNYWYPNGKLEFSGQVNRVNFKYGISDSTVKLTVYSDGLDMSNYIARGYPFAYTTDVSIPNSDANITVTQDGGKGAGWHRYGQTWKVGAGVTNIGAITLRLYGTATVTVSVYDGPAGNFLGSATRSVSYGSLTSVDFEFAQLIDVTPGGTYFFAVSVAAGQSINLRRSNSNVYADGSLYESIYSGESGGGSYVPITAYDMWMISKSGTPTTTATYTSDDPVADMASGIMIDYNNRGGLITERDFEATGLSLTYTFVLAFIFDAINKILELCPTGYYVFVDLGSAEMDIKQVNTAADYTVVRGRHIFELDLAMTIEQVKNYLLLSGGDTGGGTNLYRDYRESNSASFYGLRTVAKSDNRITLSNTADAIGDTFIEENADEAQETTLTVLSQHINISLLTPGKTIGFRNFGNFIDNMVLQIVRREINFSDGTSLLTLGRLPVRLPDEIQRINRELLNEQTINNPSSPS